MRKPEWKQLTPRDEIRCLTMAAQGHLLNEQDGIGKNNVGKALKFLDDVQFILRNFIVESDWEAVKSVDGFIAS